MVNVVPYLPGMGGALSLLTLWAAYKTGRKRRLLEGLPTSKTTGVFIGFVELKGTAESAAPLISFLAEQACVVYRWQVEEHWSRTVTETYTDDKGKTQTRTRTESGWKQIADGGEMIPFYLKDEEGCILIRPEQAKIETIQILAETCSPGDPLYYGKGPAEAIWDSTYRRRFVETAIPLQAALYVVGQARERQDVVAPEIAADSQAPLFLISTRTEEQVRRGMQWGAIGWIILGLMLVVGGALGRDALQNIPLPAHLWFYGALAAGYLLVGTLAWTWMIYNSLVDLRNRVRQAWSLVDIQLQRRFDLIPNLTTCVQGYRDYEARLQTELAAIRAQLQATPPGMAGPDHTAISGLVAGVAERYPELQANEGFLTLQKNLTDTEQRIALARSYFNEIATHYNTRLKVIPEKYIGRLGGMQPQALMAANDFARAAVTVDLTPAR